MSSGDDDVHHNAVGTAVGYVRMAALALFVWDWTLTLPDEVELIWKSRWTRTKTMYILLRFTSLLAVAFDTYTALKSGLSRSFCKLDPKISTLGVVLIIVQVQIILQLRLYAMYGRSLKILVVNAFLFIVELAVTLLLTLRVLPQGSFLTAPTWVIGSCYAQHPKTLWMSWLPPLIYETYLAMLASFKLLIEPRGQWARVNVLSVIVRDSMLFYVFIVSVLAACSASFALLPLFPGPAISGIVDVASAIGGTRLIISLRKRVWTPTLPSTVNVSNTRPQFATPPHISRSAAGSDTLTDMRFAWSDDTVMVVDREQEIDRPLRKAFNANGGASSTHELQLVGRRADGGGVEDALQR